MRQKEYKAVEEEAERLRQQFTKRHPEASKECGKLRSNLGALKPGARRQALILVRRMEALDEALAGVKQQIIILQKTLDMDQRRDGIIRQEEHQRKDRIRQERLQELQKVVDERRARRKALIQRDEQSD